MCNGVDSLGFGEVGVEGVDADREVAEGHDECVEDISGPGWMLRG